MTACAEDDACVCLIHFDCDTCLDEGTVEQTLGDWSIPIPCPDCAQGDPR